MSSILASVALWVKLDPTPEHFGDDADLLWTLLEASEVDAAGDNDLAGRDRRDPANGQEHAALAGYFHDKSDHARAAGRAAHDDDIAHATDAITVGVEDRTAGDARGEDPVRAHALKPYPAWPRRSRARMAG